METRCKFWLAKKNRFCANTRLSDSLFCGNHNPKSEEQRIPCPIDPSHSVLQENLESHVKRCPLLKQVQSLELQPFYKKGINGGREDDDNYDDANPKEVENFTFSSKLVSGSSDNITSNMKRNAVYKMTVPEFAKLIRKIESIHGSICSNIQDSYKIPEACGIWIKKEVHRKLPFQEKHVLQQASILGNLAEFGVLENSVGHVVHPELGDDLSYDGLSRNDIEVPAVVEFGAGRAYLTQLLADCYGIKKVFLVERKSYKLKADRSLRQKESLILERLRIDIEDLNLNAVESLRGLPYLAIGKHLCGPATDLTLRCCLPEQCSQENEAIHSSGSCCLKGLAVATCCHHLCQWKHYINKIYFSNLGMTKDDFHAITWFTSWAVDADHGSNLSDIVDRGLLLHSIEKKYCGADTCGVEEIVKNMEAVERAVLGFMCKEIIDMGRLMWIKEHGLETQLVKYVPSNISPENHLLVAKCSNRL